MYVYWSYTMYIANYTVEATEIYIADIHEVPDRNGKNPIKNI